MVFHLARGHDQDNPLAFSERVTQSFTQGNVSPRPARGITNDGLTRGESFKALATDPRLLLQEPATVIGSLEAVMDHYAADPALRRDYLRAAVDQPDLFRTPPESVFATIAAAADRLEAQGLTSSDLP